MKAHHVAHDRIRYRFIAYCITHCHLGSGMKLYHPETITSLFVGFSSGEREWQCQRLVAIEVSLFDILQEYYSAMGFFA